MTGGSFHTNTYDIPKTLLGLYPVLSKFSFLLFFVNSAHTDMYDTLKESCTQGLHFFFLYLKALSNLWGHYDPETEKTDFLCVTVSFLHTE